MKKSQNPNLKFKMDKPERHQWLTKKEVKAITRDSSDGGLETFVRDHNLHVRKKGNRNLYIADEVHAAMNSGAVRADI